MEYKINAQKDGKEVNLVSCCRGLEVPLQLDVGQSDGPDLRFNVLDKLGVVGHVLTGQKQAVCPDWAIYWPF